MTELLTWLKLTEKFFFDAMRQGWASGSNGHSLPKEQGGLGVEGWNEISYEDPLHFQGYRLFDRWGRDPDSGKPSGQTIITQFKMPVWAMWYGDGAYPKEAIPLLREVLMVNYRDGTFCGGRGPNRYEKGSGLCYTNRFWGDFAKFEGEEWIDDAKTGNRLGSHRYWGGSLVYVPKS